MNPKRYQIVAHEDYFEIQNPNGPTLGTGRLTIKEENGLAFKNLSGLQEVLPYEDWRLTSSERGADLAKRLDIEEIAGLMLFSAHQMVPFRSFAHYVGYYDGKPYEQGKTDPSALTDQQKRFLHEEHIRNVLLALTESAEISARWNNHLQKEAEQDRWGIPVCISSDPRHAAGKKGAEFSGTGKEVSRWPEGLGMGATFDPDLVKEFASIVAKEYRAMGITLALGPQIDLATEPRWMRLEDTLGGNAETVTAMARSYCDGLQTTEGSPDGWGKDSVAAMVKHWPGGGTGEGGRDAHYAYGKYAVFPGNRLNEHMKPFTEGAFKLTGATTQAAAVMPYYSISWNQDQTYGENVGNAYSRYLITDMLRGKYGYDGVVCTDWNVTGDPFPTVDGFGVMSHGAECLPEAERYLKILDNGVDMFGGCSRIQPILDAYKLGCERYGNVAMRKRMEESAARILTVMFRLGLFDNPYVDPKVSKKIVGCPEYVEAGLEAQRRSVVLLKNQNQCLPLKKGTKIYVPNRHIGPGVSFLRTPLPEQNITPLLQSEAMGFFQLVETPEEADAAIVFMESPMCNCYSQEDIASGGNGYLPITLQYRPYAAVSAREHSIANGDLRENDCDRSYHGKVNTARNESDLDNVLNAREAMGDKPVIVCLQIHNPTVVSEFERDVDGMVAHFGVENKVLLEILTGEKAPTGRLPIILPANMDTVEHHQEDVFDDIEPHRDLCGNYYDFGFGLRFF